MTRIKPALPLLALLALSACGTPQERCIRSQTRDLRVLDGLIADSTRDIARGYTIVSETRTRTVWAYCEPIRPPAEGEEPRPRPCLEDETYTVDRPQAIDIAAERRTLEQMQTKRAELNRSAAAAIDACRRKFPEDRAAPAP